ncbi:MAG: 5-formyltetrahydrofolate cyclo-ligase [Planctomycetales bacterium]|nr:5-formyltetrahydrofolate cyclo-ligase [Planctomycetales bacterium]
MDKGVLRQKLRQQLVQMSREEVASKSKQICDHVIGTEVFQKASVVMLFLSMPHEVDTTPLILTAWQRGKTVAVPKISWQQRHMIPVEITSLETGLKTDLHGLRNPTGGVPVPYDEIDLVITPGLGFDATGNRLGRGGSYYDTFFTSNKITAARWAVAFSNQVCDRIPHDDSDVPVEAVVTENGIMVCKRN